MNVCYVVSDGINEFNSSWFRAAIPAGALVRAGHTVHILNVRQWLLQTEYAKSILHTSDIIHLQRVLVSETHKFVTYWRKRGKAVTTDFDDHYSLIHPDNAAAKFWLHGRVSVRLEHGIQYDTSMSEHPLMQFKKGLPHCSAGITPSKVLSRFWETHTPMFVVPNYLESKMYLNARKHVNDPYIVLGWGGSLSHVQSWKDSGINEALKRILQERDNVRLLIVGDKRVVDQLPLRRDKVWFSPYIGWWAWQNTLKRYDIGLAPLAGDYDDGRSNLKVAEYLLAALPFVASKSPVYEDFVTAKSGLFVQHGHDKETYDERIESWYNSTIDVIDRIEYYKSMAKEAIDLHGMRYDVDRNVDNILSVYQEIIDIKT